MIVRVDQLSHSYGERQALRDLSFSVRPAEAFGILGPNGSGKSTLFRILSTLERPQAGRFEIAGASSQGPASAIRLRTGIVFQNSSLDQRLSVEENLRAQGHLYGLSGSQLTQRIDSVLNDFSLNDRRREPTRALSGGLQRRVEIAKAILHQPRVLLLDEASTGLDPAARTSLWTVLDRLRKELGTTIVFTTHLMEEAEQASTLLFLQDGVKLAEDAPAQLKQLVGGDVVIFESDDPDLGAELESRFGVSTRQDGKEIRVETEQGHRFIATAMDALPGRIRSASLRRPTLEDAFLKLSRPSAELRHV